MIKVDLITGFLGSGKTTFIRKYVEYLNDQGKKVGVIENDFGALNIDMVMLSDMESDMCVIEQIVGGYVESDWKRRFRAKLIAMSMQGLERVVVEPSGIYDVDAFFDVLYDEPVCDRYEPGNIIAIVDAKCEADLSKQSRYLMTSQIANAGSIVFSKVGDTSKEELQETTAFLRKLLLEFHCNKPLTENIFTKPWDEWTHEDFGRLLNSGWISADHEKLWFNKEDAFGSLFFMDVTGSLDEIKLAIKKIFADEGCGHVMRIKGFFGQTDGKWTEINATKEHFSKRIIDKAQPVFIVIGEGLKQENIGAYLR